MVHPLSARAANPVVLCLRNIIRAGAHNTGAFLYGDHAAVPSIRDSQARAASFEIMTRLPRLNVLGARPSF